MKFGEQSKPFDPVYVPDQSESVTAQPLVPFTFSERMREIWRSQTDSDAGSSLMSETVLTPIAQRARRVGPKLTAKDANERYPVDLPYLEDIHEAEAKFLHERSITRGRYARVAAETPWYELYPAAMASNIAIDMPFYAAFNIAAAGANVALQGTRVGLKIARAQQALSRLGKSGALGKVGQFAIVGALEEAGEELAFTPLRAFNSVGLHQQFTMSDAAQNVGEGFVGGAILGGGIGLAVGGFQKVFNKTRAKDIITQAESDIANGYVPPTHQQLKQADEAVYNNIPQNTKPEMEFDPSTDVADDLYAGLEVSSSNDLESSSIPIEGIPFSGTEFTGSQGVASALGGDGVAHVKLGDAQLLDLSQPLTPEVKKLMIDKLEKALGTKLTFPDAINNQTFLATAKAIGATSKELHAELEADLKALGYDGIAYDAGTIGEGGTPTSATAHKGTLIFKGQEGKLKPQAMSKVTPNQEVATASSKVDPEHYNKKESLINYDPDIDAKITEIEQEITKLGEDSLETLDQDKDLIEMVDQEAAAYIQSLPESSPAAKTIKKTMEDNKPVTKDQLDAYVKSIIFCTKRGG